MSGSHNVSHMPSACSVQVPLVTKSIVLVMLPIKSILQINGSFEESNPATTGPTKKGPNLEITNK